MAQSASALAEMTAIVDRLFCQPGSPYGEYRRGGAGSDVHNGVMYRFALSRETRAFSLQVFRGVGGLGGQLWDQEVKALARLAAMEHPVLPNVITGGHDRESDLAFVITATPTSLLSDDGAMTHLRSRPVEALRHLSMLADGMATLHSQSIVHRNFWPGAIHIARPDARHDDELTVALVIGRFELSALVHTMLTASGFVSQLALAQFYEDQPREARVYYPPERIAWLAGEPPVMESDRGDVFGLGLIAWQWFVGDLPDDLGAAERLPPGERVREVLRVLAEMRSELRRSSVPDRLQDVIREMLRERPIERYQASDVSHALVKHYDAITGAWEIAAGLPDPKPYLIGFWPKESALTLPQFGWIENDPGTPEGEIELTEFLKTELSGATILYSPEGATPYIRGDNEALAQARYVIIGQYGAWFTALFYHRPHVWNPNHRVAIPEMLSIRFVQQRSRPRVAELEATTRFRRFLPPVEVVPIHLGEVAIDAVQNDYESWEPVLKSIKRPASEPNWRLHWRNVLDFSIDHRQVEFDLRAYPFTADKRGQTATLRFDAVRDRERIHKKGDHYRLYAADTRRRAPFGYFFQDALRPNLSFADGPDWSNHRNGGNVLFRRFLDEDTIEVAGDNVRSLPKEGWLRPADDRGMYEALRRERDAKDELFRLGGLVGQLHSPRSVRTTLRDVGQVGDGLRGEAPLVIREMLANVPFFALHGPPGTGKTTVTAEAVNLALADPSTRILISAQSHYALDNLALRIVGVGGRSALRRMRHRGIVGLRIASGDADRIHKDIQPLIAKHLTQEIVDEIRHACEQRLARGDDSDEVRRLVADWMAQADDCRREIAERISRGANVVFGTCASAMSEAVGGAAQVGAGAFDWVIVDEAAKAWPTELAMPLVLGTRWTLIGDHRQLPAFQRNELDRFLAQCADDQSELGEIGKAKEAYGKVLDVFKSLFESERGSAQPHKPLAELRLQFRMRTPIARMVSEAFYGNADFLETDPTADVVEAPVTAPPELRGSSLVWIDTKGVPRCEQLPYWWNPGEAQCIQFLLEKLQPRSLLTASTDDKHPLAILSPYLQQVEAIRKVVPDPWRDFVHTLDSFQGREATILIASLVRSKRSGDVPVRNIGFLVDPARVNVLCSRARQLLIVIGRFEQFADSGVPFWKKVCDSFVTNGRIVPLEQLVGEKWT